MKKLRVYVAGKVSSNSVFGTHDWRDGFCKELEELSGMDLVNFDPTKTDIDQSNTETVFEGVAYMISQVDVLICYFSDDISVGGSQEVLIAKYFNKPVIGLAPAGGKFNGSTKKYFGKIVNNYKDPFVFSTCDIVCADINEVAEALKRVSSIQPKDIDLIGELSSKFVTNNLEKNPYIKNLLNLDQD